MGHIVKKGNHSHNFFHKPHIAVYLKLFLKLKFSRHHDDDDNDNNSNSNNINKSVGIIVYTGVWIKHSFTHLPP